MRSAACAACAAPGSPPNGCFVKINLEERQIWFWAFRGSADVQQLAPKYPPHICAKYQALYLSLQSIYCGRAQNPPSLSTPPILCYLKYRAVGPKIAVRHAIIESQQLNSWMLSRRAKSDFGQLARFNDASVFHKLSGQSMTEWAVWARGNRVAQDIPNREYSWKNFVSAS
jgi:hypothetical protein